MARTKDKPLVIIVWEDSAQPLPGWQLMADYEPSGAINCASVGWLVHDGKDIKVLAPNMGGLDGNAPPQISGMMQIPARCIVSITKLAEVGKPG